MLTRLGNSSDITGIVALQKANLYVNLSATGRQQGFVTTPFSESQLTELMTQRGIFVAEEEGTIFGYAMAGDWKFFSQWPIFPFMVSRLSLLTFQGMSISSENSFQYGPVCIDSSHRGSALFPKLFEEMRLEFQSRFPVGVTFINQINEHSYRAHTRKLFMNVIDEFKFSGQNYHGLAFDTSKSVLNPEFVSSKNVLSTSH